MCNVCVCNAGIDPMDTGQQRGLASWSFCFCFVSFFLNGIACFIFFLYIYIYFVQHVHFINKCKCDARADLNTRKTPRKKKRETLGETLD